ncbi:MAG: phosphodiester glycosidase family protein [Oscillospiraceae bacterium]|nr:phosphodiester glycosidase family protein [Oscillospiraceae bacterium]
MKSNAMPRFLALLLVIVMLLSVLPLNVFAASIKYDDSNGGSDYYQVISQRDWELAPGIDETEIVLNNDAGTRRQVVHTVAVDLNNPYTKVIPGYKGMWPKEGNYGTESTSTQALNAEKLGYGNVVAATNCSLSWYTEAYYQENPHLIGEPLGYSILDGQLYENSRRTNGTLATGGVATIVVINYDKHPLTGEDRPADMPKVWIRSSTDPLTGWEEQAIPVLFTFLVKPDANGNPVNQYKEDHGSGIASRTFVGVKADGTLVIAVSDGEQAPYSTGFTSYEMAEYMIKMGCVIAANCDGGGSTTFCTQRPGEDLKVNCSLSDGGERPTTNTILVISTAPADGVFARATLDAEYDYYTPGSTVTFSALGTDAVGTKVDIPADAQWTIKEEGMGTIENGVFTSNGTEGTVTAQLVYDGQVVGERSITIATPDELSFEQPVVTIPFGKTAAIPVKATIGGGVYEIGLGPNDVTFTTTNPALGAFDGLNFVAVDEANAPEDITSVVTATLNMGTNPSATVQLNLGKASQVLWDFEGGQTDIDIWNVVNNRKNAAHWDYELELSLADRTNGQVHDGNYSMRLETNGLSSKDSHSEQYAWIRLGVDGEALVLENARSVGFWLYVPEDNIQCWVQGHYMTDSNGDGVFDTENVVSMMESENVYYNIDESGWHYLSMDISAFEQIALKAAKQYDKDPSDGMSGETGEFFLAIVFHKAINNKLWQENGSINGNYTYYLDNFTVDYSEAVEDRENPVFDKIYLDGTTALVKRDVVTTTSNVLNLSAAVADCTTRLDADKNEVPLYNASGLDAATAKVYIDGVEVESTLADGKLSANGIKVADGYHRVKFEICDKMGNKSVVIRVVKVESGVEASTLKLVPADATLDRIPFGSIYWMNLEATAIETIQSVSTVIDLNNVNHWELDHMELAYGFSAEYTIDEETNTATITFTRTGEVDLTGAAVLAKIPVRILYFDTDIQVPGYTAETYWTTYKFWAQDMKMDVDKGEITYVDGYESDVLNTFSNEEFHVDTEMYTSMANMDKAYFTEHGTTHVHTPAAIADKAPTCTENGYTGRTFCEGCNSVVEWGTTIPATGHSYKPVDGVLVCDCGKASTATGLYIIDGRGYYAVNGKLTGGWVAVGDDWYYFDETTCVSVDSYNNGYVTFLFEADGKLISGQWHHSEVGSRYYYGPTYHKGMSNGDKWVEIDGEDYCFDKYGYCLKGIRFAIDDYKEYYAWYDFGTDGACLGMWEHTGIVHWNGNTYYLVDGVSRSGMFYGDGAYYYAGYNNQYAAIKNMERLCNNNNGVLPTDTYRFGYDGRMVDHDVYNVNGVLYYYVMGQISQGDGVFTVDGVDYIVEASGKVLYTGLLVDASGQKLYYENGIETEWIKNGLIRDDDGEVRYYVDGVATRAGLVRDDDGNYYYINSSLKAVKNCTYTIGAAMTNGLLPAGTYRFDANGVMIDPPYVECEDHKWGQWVVTTPATEAAAGVETRECAWCDVSETREIPKLEHVHAWSEWVVTTPATEISTGVETRTCATCGETETQLIPMLNCTHTWGDWIVMTAATDTSVGVEKRACTTCGATESQEIPMLDEPVDPSVKNGLTWDDDGEVRYYVDGVPTRAGLVKDAECNFYYINSTLKAVKNRTYTIGAAMTNGLLPAGTYQFDAEGRMIDPPVDVCKVHFWGEWTAITDTTETRRCHYCGTTETQEISGQEPPAQECAHSWGEWIVTTPATETATGIETRTCSLCGATETQEIPVVEPPVEECAHSWGEWVVTTPATETATGVETRTCSQCGATETQEIPMVEKPVDPNVKNGLIKDEDGEIRYYVDGVPTRAGLVQDDEGNYYYINSTLKAVKNCTYAFSDAMSNGLLPGGTYQFDAEGKLIMN